MPLRKSLPWLGIAIGAVVLSRWLGWKQSSNGYYLGDRAHNNSLSSFALSDEEAATCHIHRRTAFEQAPGPVSISHSPLEHPDVPRLSSANATAWEQWEFDGTSDSAESGILINFTRDPSYHFFGQGNLRVELFLMLDGRPVLRELDFVEESTVAVCAGHIAGIWTASDRAYRFDIPTDMSEATVQWTTRRSSGHFHVRSATPPFLASGSPWPSDESTAQLSPTFSSAQPIAGGRMDVVHYDASGRSTFSGSGGHTRFWATDGWFTFAGGFNQIRATAGPYVLSYWQHESREAVSANRTVRSAHLFKDGVLLMSAVGDGPAIAEQDHVIFHADFHGDVKGPGAPQVSGRTIEFVSPGRNTTWCFVLRHRRRQFDITFGDGKGLSGFAASVEGGEVGKKLEYGSAFVEHTAFPVEFKQWQIYAVYAMHKIGTWWKQLSN